MKTKIAIITDSTALLTEETLSKELVYQIPLQVIVNDYTYQEGLDITVEDFYKKLKVSKIPAKTSQPNLGTVIELFEKLKSDGIEQVLLIHCSSKLSGTYNTSLNASNFVGLNALHIDSLSGAFPLEYLVNEAIKLRDKGNSLKDIHTEVSSLVNRFELHFSPCNLDQLKRSGRVSGASQFFGNLLSIRLILSFNDGEVFLTDKVRSNKKMKSYLFDRLEKDIQESTIKEISVIHCNNVEEANAWQEELKTIYPNYIIHSRELSAVVGVHAGEGTIGLSWVY